MPPRLPLPRSRPRSAALWAVALAACLLGSAGADARADTPAAAPGEQALAVLGTWHAPAGDDSGRASIVELFLRDGQLYGRILRTVDAQGAEIDAACKGCPDDLAGQPLKGMTFVRDLKPDGDRWVDGRVMDLRPGWSQGMVGICEIRMVGDRLELFGYRGLRALGETSTWTRIGGTAERPEAVAAP